MRLRLNQVVACLAVLGLCTLVAQESQAQFGTASTSTFGASNTGTEGQASNALEQTGQVTSDAAINRGSGFVGGDSSDGFTLRNAPTNGNTSSASARGMTGMAGGRGGMGGRGGQQNQLGGGRNTTRQALRFPFRIGFESVGRAAPVVKATAERRITKLPGIQSENKIVVVIEKETAVLQGTAVNDKQRDLIARLMLLEPGVYKVRNELVVQATP